MENNDPQSFFLEEYANWREPKRIFLTVDVDWAPDYMIEYLLDIFREFNTSATVFTTHPSTLLKNLQHDDNFEISHHLYIDEASSQGKDVVTAINYLKKYYPHAAGNRFHLLAHSYRHLECLGDFGYQYDVSVLRFNGSYLLPVFHHDLQMVLLTYCWEDGICENSRLPLNVSFHNPGVKIINFHPLNVYLNGEDSSNRIALLKDNPSLLDCPRPRAHRYRSQGNGAEVALRNLLRSAERIGCRTSKIKDLIDAFKQHCIDASAEPYSTL